MTTGRRSITYQLELPALANVPTWSNKPVPVLVIGETRMKYVVRVLGADDDIRYVPRHQVEFLDNGE